jgi:hypothetical protein
MSYLCGCYYHIASTEYHIRIQKHYLPLLSSTVHSTILSTTSRTKLTQKFTNPSTTTAIKECIYNFPLYDGVSVVSFTCRIGKRVLRGLVKEKQTAKKIFDEAVSKGETAGLLEQTDEAADVFSTKLGNIPAGGSVIVEIEYVGELKHHETEGIRFTIPTKIAPRYGARPVAMGGVQAHEEGRIKITVDVNMQEGSFIKGVQSPSHPIAVSMGTVSTASTADPAMSKASATLSLGSAALEKDFVLIVQSKDVGIPKAILETHPTIRNHRALMATLVPKFSLPPSRPEIVFVADRSGSMQHNIPMLVSAMKVFLKSIPVGVKFNICSFGSSHTFLWPKSQSYSQETLQQASNHLLTFDADYGGTETFGAVQATIGNRFTDLPLEIILLTDGDIWQQEALFQYVNQQVEQTNGNIRIFPLGIGNGVSHSLIEGLARAGNGFAQAVQDGERLDNCVVRMLRGALSPHIKDYTLEVKYEKENDDFELIDKVTEGMKVLLSEDEKTKEEKPTISLFDANVNPEKEDLKGLQHSAFWLPDIPFPKLHQAPHKIPTLFAFSRTSVYLLMSPETIQRNPTAVILRATSTHGPLALEIPIENLATPSETIHQLAAKKAVQDLEEGRGWIYDAKDQNGMLVKERYASRFDDLVQKEAVRLGEKFQIAGKWCSFVAVAANDKEIAEKEESMREQKSLVVDDDGEILAGESTFLPFRSSFVFKRRSTNCFAITDMDMSAQLDLYAAEEDEDEETDDGFAVIGTPSSSAPAYSPPAPASPQPSAKRGLNFRGGMKEAKGTNPARQSLGSKTPVSQPSPMFALASASTAIQKPQPCGSSAFGSSNEKFRGPVGGSPAGAFGKPFGGAGLMTRDASKSAAQRQYQSPPQAFGASAPNPAMQAQPSGAAVLQSNIPAPQPQPMAPGCSLFGSTSSARYSMNYSHSQVSSPAQAFGNAAPTDQFYGRAPPQAPLAIGLRPNNLFGGITPPPAPAPAASKKSGELTPEMNAPFIAHGYAPRATGSPVPGIAATAAAVGDVKSASRARRAGFNTFLKKTKKRSSLSAASELQDSDTSSPEGDHMKLSLPAIDWSSKSVQEKVARFIELQTFEGSWAFDVEVFSIMGLGEGQSEGVKRQDGVNKHVWVTLLVVKWLEIMAGEEEGVWSMVVEKARGWLEGQTETALDALENDADSVVKALQSA